MFECRSNKIIERRKSKRLIRFPESWGMPSPPESIMPSPKRPKNPSPKKPSSPFAPKRSPYSPKPVEQVPTQRPAQRPASPFGQKAVRPGFKTPAGAQTHPRPSAFPQRSPVAATPQRASLPIPCAMVSRRASESLRNGHVWVYASDLEQIEIGGGDAPALIPVVDNRAIPLGTALYSPASQISLRLVSRELISSSQWLELLAARLKAAMARRLPLLTGDTDSCRLVFSEADELPGIIVDKYAGVVILQLLTKGLDTAETREVCIRVLSEELAEQPLTIWERPDPRIRELEGLSAPATTPLFTRGAKGKSKAAPVASTVFRLNGLSFHFDANSGQKTGAFLDQRQNYAAATAWARARGAKRALDVCTYQGGFALHLAQVCEQVTGVDASRASLEVADRNLEVNRDKIPAEVDWVEADAFELLRAWSESKDQADWDLIVLDPPAFAKSKRAVEGALRGYKELNLRALRMIKPGGLLITCSCSHHVSWNDLEGAVASAAIDAHRRVTLLERRGAALDHPVLLNLPETEYLKCLICQVD
jgi:23S rRNA (cytosine1962-C5)-methyltransferase